MQIIQNMLSHLLRDGQPAVLAMIVNVEGSAYRKEGSWMFIQKDGTQVGIISGGCLESDLHERAKKIFGTGKAEVVDYDLSSEDDLGWGRGTGCNGIISVLVRDVDENFRAFCEKIYSHLLSKRPVLYRQSMQDFGAYECIRKEDSLNMLSHTTATTPFEEKAGLKTKDQHSFYHQIIWPQPALYIFGTGADARPLAQLASQAGYAVHLLDWRESLCNMRYFPTAHALKVGNICDLVSDISFSPLDSVILMTHDFQYDTQILQQIRHDQLLYVGVLGSKKRTERLLGEEIPPWIHSPVGLSIGADGPVEIAISIVAELIAVRRRKKT